MAKAVTNKKTKPVKKKTARRGLSDTNRWVIGAVLFAVAFFLLVAVIAYYFYWSDDQIFVVKTGLNPPPKASVMNPAGLMGAKAAHYIVGQWFGVFGLAVPILLIIIALRIIDYRPAALSKSVRIGLVVMILGSLSLGYLFGRKWGIFGTGLGGDHGIYIAEWIESYLGKAGTGLMLLLGWILLGVYINRRTILVVNRVGKGLYDGGRRVGEAVRGHATDLMARGGELKDGEEMPNGGYYGDEYYEDDSVAPWDAEPQGAPQAAGGETPAPQTAAESAYAHRSEVSDPECGQAAQQAGHDDHSRRGRAAGRRENRDIDDIEIVRPGGECEDEYTHRGSAYAQPTGLQQERPVVGREYEVADNSRVVEQRQGRFEVISPVREEEPQVVEQPSPKVVMFGEKPGEYVTGGGQRTASGGANAVNAATAASAVGMAGAVSQADGRYAGGVGQYADMGRPQHERPVETVAPEIVPQGPFQVVDRASAGQNAQTVATENMAAQGRETATGIHSGPFQVVDRAQEQSMAQADAHGSRTVEQAGNSSPFQVVDGRQTAQSEDSGPFRVVEPDRTAAEGDARAAAETAQGGLQVIERASGAPLGVGGVVESVAPQGAPGDRMQVVVAGRNDVQLEDEDIDDALYDPTKELPKYQRPPVELLEDHSVQVEVTEKEIYDNKNQIVNTLKNFGVAIDKIKATIGPTVTLYEIIPAAGVKISKIKNLEDDIALSLMALGIRIIAPMPGKGTVGIEVPNKNKEVVSMYSVVKTRKFQESDYELPIVLGKTISNETFMIDLTKMPHLLVAGATGQGKSVGLNAIITSLLYRKHPAELKFVFVDPKRVELSLYSKLDRHFLAKMESEEDAILTDTQKVVYTLNSLCGEMSERYDLLQKAEVKKISEYNTKFLNRRLNPKKGHRFMPYIVVIVDEFADLIMTAGREIETPLTRLAQLARAVGIHLVIATQRPDVKVITGLIKANFPARVAFRVMSMVDSRTIIDQPGANQLIGRGDMLMSLNGELTRVQCAFVDTPEIERITEFISNQKGYAGPYSLPDFAPEGDGPGERAGDMGPLDQMFEEVARFVVQNQQGSTSSIQRRFSIGYNRAGRIMDQLEDAGIVGRAEGSKPREVLIMDMMSLEHILSGLGV